MEVYAWGSGNYGRLGLGHSNDARVPQRVSGVLNGCDVTSASCSWYHSVVVTSTGDVAAFGSRVSKCLGTAASGSEASDASDGKGTPGFSDGTGTEEEDSAFAEGLRRRGSASSGGAGRGNDQAIRQRRRHLSAGRHSRSRSSTAGFVPQVLHSFPSRVTVVQVAVGGDMLGAHTLAVSRNGRLYSWGYGPACGLGSVSNVATPTLVTKFLGTGAGEATSGRGQLMEMEPLSWGKPGHMRYRRKTPRRTLGLQILRPRIVKAACGGGFSTVMSAEGEVFTFGLSAGGRLGFRTKFRAQLRPRRIETLREGITDISAGAGFVLLCSAAGRLLAWGDNSKGQLGIGHLQASWEPITLGRHCPAAFVFQAVAAGDSHSLALDSAGRAYSWGGEGGPMTGQGKPLPNMLQVDLAFKFRLKELPYWWVRPMPIRALASFRVVHIDAGCLHSVALTQEGFLFAWGAPLQSGACALPSGRARSEAERPEVFWVPRLLAPGPKLPLARVGTVSAGGWHSLATAAPFCPFERLVTGDADFEQIAKSFCDGFLVSDQDSYYDGFVETEARVPVCCAVLRARLALPDGSDSPTWKALSAQIMRPHIEAHERRESAEEADKSDGEDEEDLLEIVALHRKNSSSRGTARKQPVQALNPASVSPPSSGPSHTSDADEAAGKAVQAPPVSKPPVPPAKKAPVVQARKPIPVFSSDSSSEDEARAPKSSAPGGALSSRSAPLTARAPLASARSAPAQSARATLTKTTGRSARRAAPVFSSDSSASDRDAKALNSSPTGAAGSSARSAPPLSQRVLLQRGPGGELLRLELRRYSEAVLAALVRFLHTDSLGALEVIDETHPLWQWEQQVRAGLAEVDTDDWYFDAVPERPSRQRAFKGLLVRREVADLREAGNALGLERLARLCDQLLLRIDAPGVPALFVPDSTLRSAMWTLLGQTLHGTSRDGPDTRLLCATPGWQTTTGRRRRARWGLRKALPADGILWAHAFMLCTGCSGIRSQEHAEPARAGGAGAGAGAAEGPDAEWQGICWLRQRRAPIAGSRAPQYELDLQDVAADVVFAWLRYLYTQDDLSLVWPCEGSNTEEATEAEAFWMELLRLGQRLGDEKLQLYAQDTLVGALSMENWTTMAAFAEQAQCPVLSEASLTMGVRLLLPPMLESFQVETGLEHLNDRGKSGQPQDKATSSGFKPAATVGRATPGRPGASRGTVELELERHLFEHCSTMRSKSRSPLDKRSLTPMALSALKRGSPASFAELKQRLAESVVGAQQAGAQLQRCAQFFDSQEKRGFQRAGPSGRAMWYELIALMALVAFFIVPVMLKQTVFEYITAALKPFAAIVPSLPDFPSTGWFAFLSSNVVRVALVNAFAVLVFVAIIWTGLKN